MFAVVQGESSSRPVDLGAFIPLEEALSCMRTRDGGLRLYRSRAWEEGGGWRRQVDSWALCGAEATPLDRTLFQLDASSFSEFAQYRSEDGPNLLERPIVLPRILGTVPVEPFPGLPFTVRCIWHGEAELRGDGWRHRCVAAALCGEGGGKLSVQWLGQGIGELAIGPNLHSHDRWLAGWSGPSGRIGEVPGFEPAPLPARGGGTPRTGIF